MSDLDLKFEKRETIVTPSGVDILIDPPREYVEKYFDLVEYYYGTVNGWIIAPLNRRACLEHGRFLVFAKQGRVVGGVMSDMSPTVVADLYGQLRGEKALPPLDMITSHENIGCLKLPVLGYVFRDFQDAEFLARVGFSFLSYLGKDYAIAAPALEPARLHALWAEFGYKRISQPVNSEYYVRPGAWREPNCVLMMRPVGKNCQIDPALLAFGATRKEKALNVA